MADVEPRREAYPVHWISRRLPRGISHLRISLAIRKHAARSDVVYTTGLLGRSTVGSVLARRPFVVKLTADPAFERARRRGLVRGELDAFQQGGGGPAAQLLRVLRNAELRRAAHVFCPSTYLRELVISWGIREERVSVLPNPAPPVDGLPPREALREAYGLNGPTLAFAGRMEIQKALGDLLEAVAEVDDVSLVLAGDGALRSSLERQANELGLERRVRFLGARPREEVVQLLRASDAAILTSEWENFPHAVLEALAAGTPVISTAVGGVPELVRDGENGLLVPPGDREALVAAIRRLCFDQDLRARLAASAAPSVSQYAPEELLARIEETLERVVG